ncbi:MAG TPA: hypothetical protein VFC19_44005 [Candidatus Limnocylindrales bacterium]|nr:hypothetical protein [Candidatus Limnocylindrales bacterium]
MTELHLRGRAAARRRDGLVVFLAEAIPFYEAPGGIRVRLLWDVTDEDSFIEVVEYADGTVCDRGQQRVENDPRMREYLGRWRALLDGPPVVVAYRVGTPA